MRLPRGGDPRHVCGGRSHGRVRDPDPAQVGGLEALGRGEPRDVTEPLGEVSVSAQVVAGETFGARAEVEELAQAECAALEIWSGRTGAAQFLPGAFFLAQPQHSVPSELGTSIRSNCFVLYGRVLVRAKLALKV